MSNLSYLITVLIFAGGANVVIWTRNDEFLRSHRAFIVMFALLTTPFAAFESFALRWGAWEYNPQRVIDARLFGAQIESYLFMMLVSAAVAGATLVYAHREDGRRRAGERPHTLRARKR
jgi:lycopene cyclase domain-containing protein